MELRRYLKLLRDHWVVVSLAFSITLVGTIIQTVGQPWIYESGGTYIVRPRAEANDEIVAAFNALSRGIEINSTYAAIARSDAVVDRAAAAIGVSTAGVKVDSDVIPGTNMISISVRGQEPDDLRPLAEAVGAESVKFIAAMEDAYVIQVLDRPSEPGAPVGPNKALTIATSAVLGLILGAVLAFLIDYFASIAGYRASFEALDPHTGAYSSEYFNLRLKQELSRIEDTGGSFAVGTLRLREWEDDERIPAVRRVREIVELVSGALRVHDILCTTEPGTLKIVFPSLSQADCALILSDWQAAVEGAYDTRPVRVELESHEYTSTKGGGTEQSPVVVDVTET